MATKKLIEVALPLEAINAESAYEKLPGIGAHPRGLHQWWARRPFVTARAVIWASLVNDPSSDLSHFPTEEDQRKERERLFDILSRLVLWKNSNNKEVLDEAWQEILKSTDGNPPVLLDPFAGGGAIPIEGQRLGLKSVAMDLNPIAILINKSMIEITPRFIGYKPANPEAQFLTGGSWDGLTGFVNDIRYYGRWIHQKAEKEIGYLYPKMTVQSTGVQANVVAWIWARTAKCPNPACGCEMPLVGNYILAKKKGRCSWIEPVKDGTKFKYIVRTDKNAPTTTVSKKGRGAAFVCPNCGEITLDSYIKQEGENNRIGASLMAVIADSKKGRLYLSPDQEQINAAIVDKPEDYPDGPMPTNPRWFSPPAFGMKNYGDIYTNRQLTALTKLSDLVRDVKLIAEQDAIKAGYKNDHIALCDGGQGARAYSEAISVYLAFAVDRITAFSNTVSRWSNSNEKIMNCYARQALPMVWDFPEANVLGDCVGGFLPSVDYIADCVNTLVSNPKEVGKVQQQNAQEDCGLRGIMISTDPPYYDNVGYADLSDFYYIWLRRMLKDIFPNVLGTMLVPKADELIATPYRFNGSTERAKEYFEDGMYKTCCHLYEYSRDDVPVSIYYAFRQTDSSDGNEAVSTGWETMLSAIIRAGFTITGTWPMRTEQSTRVLGNGTNALASSIVLICRKRPSGASQVTRRNLINILRRELRPALKKLQESNIAPVDLAQAAIGPGMSVFSRFSKVLEADGTPMSVRSAQHVINEEVDLYFNEQVGDLDAMSRFCVDLYTQNAFNDIKFGDADILARAKGTSVAALASHDVVYAKAGTVHLIERTELPEKIDSNENCIWMLTQQMTQAMATGGVEACAKAVFTMFGSNAEKAKDLAYRLYTIAEQKKWATEAFAYNALVVAWPDIQSRAAMIQRETPEQLDLFSMGLLNP